MLLNNYKDNKKAIIHIKQIQDWQLQRWAVQVEYLKLHELEYGIRLVNDVLKDEFSKQAKF